MSNMSIYVVFGILDEVFIYLCIWTVKLQSLGWWGWCNLSGRRLVSGA